MRTFAGSKRWSGPARSTASRGCVRRLKSRVRTRRLGPTNTALHCDIYEGHAANGRSLPLGGYMLRLSAAYTDAGSRLGSVPVKSGRPTRAFAGSGAPTRGER